MDTYSEKTILNIPSESKQIEFKRVGGEEGVVSKMLETIAAMANTDGGHIILGVNDPERNELKGVNRILGIEEKKENYDEIRRRISDILPEPEMKFQEISASNGKTIAVLRVEKATERGHYYNDKCFIRLEKGNYKLTLDEFLSFQYSKGFKKSDEEIVDVSMDLLETEHYREWFNKEMRRREGEKIEPVLESKGLARKDDDGILRPTRAAVMLFAEYPTDLMDTKCAIKIAVYDSNKEVFGETPNFIKRVILNSPIKKIIKDAQEYVLENIKDGFEIKGKPGFAVKYKIPERVMREAVTNAVIHRDYHAKIDIMIKIFTDRIEIWNTGLLYSNITLQNIGSVHAESHRNDLLIKRLREFPSAPNYDANEGVSAMREEMDAHNLYRPVYKLCALQGDIPDTICLTLWYGEIDPEWEKIREYLEQEKYINNETARGIIGGNTRRITYLFKKWVDKGVLIPIDINKNRLYKTPKTSELP